MNRRSAGMMGVALATALGCADLAHAQATVGASAGQGRSVNARTPTVPGTNQVAPAPGGNESFRTGGALVAPVGPTEREIAISQSVLGAIEASHLAAIAATASPNVGDRPAVNSLGEDLRGTSDRAFLDTRRRVAAFAGDPGQDGDAGIARTRTSARFGYLAGRYIHTLAALHGKAPDVAEPAVDAAKRPTPAALVANGDDAIRIALVNDSVRKVLTARALRRDLATVNAPSGTGQELTAQARVMENEGRQMLMRLATNAPAVEPAAPVPGSTTTAPPDTPLTRPDGRVTAKESLSSRAADRKQASKESPSGRGENAPGNTPTTRPGAMASLGRPTGDDPALGNANRPTAIQLARIGLELVDSLPSSAGVDAEIRGQRLPDRPASEDRDVPPAIAPGGTVPRF